MASSIKRPQASERRQQQSGNRATEQGPGLIRGRYRLRLRCDASSTTSSTNATTETRPSTAQNLPVVMRVRSSRSSTSDVSSWPHVSALVTHLQHGRNARTRESIECTQTGECAQCVALAVPVDVRRVTLREVLELRHA